MPGTTLVIKEETGLFFMELMYLIFIFKESCLMQPVELGLYLSIELDGLLQPTKFPSKSHYL